MEKKAQTLHSPFGTMVKVPIQPLALQPISRAGEHRETTVAYWEHECPMYSKSNIPATNPIHDPLKGGLAGALWAAYNYHADVVLSPDDVWITICHAFSTLVNARAEKLRSHFVDHAGKKDLIVRVISAPHTPAEWDHVLNLFHEAVKGAVKADAGKLLECSFSTSGPIEKAASAVATMTTFQAYFTYMCQTMCGIRNVYFMGTLEDWFALREKVAQLGKFECETWTSSLGAVIDQFIATYQGEVDLDFWNKVIHIHSTHGSGAATYLSGWVTQFFPFDDKGRLRGGEFNIDYVPQPIFTVPFILNDNGVMSDWIFRAGFTGLLYENEAFRPQLSYALWRKEPPIPKHPAKAKSKPAHVPPPKPQARLLDDDLPFDLLIQSLHKPK